MGDRSYQDIGNTSMRPVVAVENRCLVFHGACGRGLGVHSSGSFHRRLAVVPDSTAQRPRAARPDVDLPHVQVPERDQQAIVKRLTAHPFAGQRVAHEVAPAAVANRAGAVDPFHREVGRIGPRGRPGLIPAPTRPIPRARRLQGERLVWSHVVVLDAKAVKRVGKAAQGSSARPTGVPGAPASDETVRFCLASADVGRRCRPRQCLG